LLEDVIHQRRQQGGGIDSNLIDLLLKGRDGLSTQVEAIANDEQPLAYDELKHALASIARGGTEVIAKPVEHQGIVTRVNLRLQDDCSSPAVRGFLVYRQILKVATVLHATPTLDQLKAGAMPDNS